MFSSFTAKASTSLVKNEAGVTMYTSFLLYQTSKKSFGMVDSSNCDEIECRNCRPT